MFSHSEIFGSKPAYSSPKLIAVYHVLHRLSVPRHPPYALKRLIYAQKKIFLSKLNFCWNVHLFEHSLIVHLFEQSDIDIDKIIYDLKMLKVSILVEDSGIEPLTS